MPRPDTELVIDPGPLVFQIQSPSPRRMSKIYRPPQPRGRRWMILGGFIIIFAATRILIEDADPMTETSPSSPSSSSNTTPRHPKSVQEARPQNLKPTAPAFDVNAPPPVEKETVVRKTFNLFDNSPSTKNRDKQSSDSSTGERSLFQHTPETKTVKNANNDDEVPHAAAGVVPTAAEALLCPDSVVDYVINATDLKDECDGLRKAFSKYCADTEGSDAKQRSPRRRLQESDEHDNNLQQPQNPILVWEMRLRYMVESLNEWFGPATEFGAGRLGDYSDDLFIEGVDSNHHSRRLNEVAEKFLREETSAERGETVPNEEEQEDENANEDEETEQVIEADEMTLEEAKKPVKATSKPKISLDLPIKGHYLSDKALSESLLLHQDDKTVIASVQAIQNATNTNTTEKAAVIDAAASLKAVSHTTELVSSLLNDPSSVEARTCCTSVLSVFHEICSVDEEENLSDKQLFISVAVIVVCGLIKSLIRHFQIRWLPEAAGCVLVGGMILVLYFRKRFAAYLNLLFLLPHDSGCWLGYLLFPTPRL